MADNFLVPPLKTIAKSLFYFFTFNIAPFRVLSWLTDDSSPWNIGKQSGEEMMVKVHFVELTQPSARQPSSNPSDLIPPYNQLVYP